MRRAVIYLDIMKKIKIICVDDEAYIVESIKDFFDSRFDCRVFSSPVEALNHLVADRTDILILDYRMPDLTGLNFLIKAHAAGAYSKAVLLTAYADKELLKDVLNMNLVDTVIEKPLNLPELSDLLDELSEKIYLERAQDEEQDKLKEVYKLLSEDDFDFDFIGKNGDLKKIWEKTVSIASTDENVLITGDTGTGKDVLANQIHLQSPRAEAPFIKINCGAIPATLIETELFGHERGAFSGAGKLKHGKIELADRGTLFLDEIGELPSELQTRLLHVVEDKAIERVGGTEKIAVDFRLISATNKNLDNTKESGFRSDLYYRLSTVHLSLPPLSERHQDLPILILSLVKKNIRHFKKPEFTVSLDAMLAMRKYSWPGNIRELENVIKQMIIMRSEDDLIISETDFSSYSLGCYAEPGFEELIDAGAAGILDKKIKLIEIEHAVLEAVLKKCGGRVMKASRRSGIPKDRFYRMQEKNR
ncbi:MAG TPA: Fis family transcriptional regulator [Spirochaeta sp.]|nr:Fis family transcriptional regulator [Spirochaeta sp.]